MFIKYTQTCTHLHSHIYMYLCCLQQNYVFMRMHIFQYICIFAISVKSHVNLLTVGHLKIKMIYPLKMWNLNEKQLLEVVFYIFFHNNKNILPLSLSFCPQSGFPLNPTFWAIYNILWYLKYNQYNILIFCSLKNYSLIQRFSNFVSWQSCIKEITPIVVWELHKYTISQSAGAVEYTDCFSAEG